MKTLERDEGAMAWDFRAAWVKGYPVIAVLDDRCMVERVVGRVSYVAVTGAFAMVDGWHLPIANVLKVDRATIAQRDEYAAEKRAQALAAEAARREALAQHVSDI